MNTNNISSCRHIYTDTHTHTHSRYSRSGEVKSLCLSLGTTVTSSPWELLPRCSLPNEWWWPRTEPIIHSDTHPDTSCNHSYSASNFIFPSKTLSDPHSAKQLRLTQTTGAIPLPHLTHKQTLAFPCHPDKCSWKRISSELVWHCCLGAPLFFCFLLTDRLFFFSFLLVCLFFHPLCLAF